jgi:ribosome biogenesis GTPase
VEEALVLKSTGKWYTLELSKGEVVQARIRGKLRLEGLSTTNPIAAGDKVYLSPDIDSDGIRLIENIVPRRNYIVRKSTNLSKQMQILAANVDHAYLVATLKSPVTQLAFIDRFLVSAESFRIPTTILFNKTDLYSEEDKGFLAVLKNIYSTLGYGIAAISTLDKSSINFLLEEINGKNVMISGNSGVGKSSLVNALDSNLDIRTGAISQAHEQGKHTTTFAEMHRLASGGYIIDTPGIRAFGMINLEKEHIAHYFPEMRTLLGQCRFHNCLHLNEPHCAVKEALSDDSIAPSRYHSYVQLMEEDADTPYRYASN